MPLFKSKYPDIVIPTNLTLPAFLCARFREHGEKKAVIDPYTKSFYTYHQLYDAIHKGGAGFHRKGVAFGHVVAVLSPNNIDYATALLAIMSIGAIPSPGNPASTVEELQHQWIDAHVQFVVTAPSLLARTREVIEKLPAGQVKEIFVFGDAPGATSFQSLFDNDGHCPRPVIDARETVAVIPYSSGTTGRSKGVELTHYNIIANVLQNGASDMPAFLADEVFICVLPLYHIYGMVYCMFMDLYAGYPIVVMPKFDLHDFLQFVQEYKVTFTHLVPPVMILLAKDPIVDKYDLSSWRGMLCGAAPLGAEVTREVSKRLKITDIRQGYGMTELSPTVCTSGPSTARKPGSTGIFLCNVVAKFIDPATGNECGVGEPGELIVNGPNKMKGYLNNPKATAATIDKDGFLHTGDIGCIDEDGYVFIVDRLKELIKYKGYQVPPAELEELLLTHPAVADAAVVGKPDEETGELPTAFVVLKKQFVGKTTEKDIHDFVSQKVAPHKRLRGGLFFVDAVPRSQAGKILRRVLRAKL